MVAACFLFSEGCSTPVPPPGNKALIIDQLEAFEPNAALVEEISGILTNSGLVVEYHRGEEITVDFYRKLTPAGSKLIILRSHAGLLGTQGKAIYKTCFFTNEPYSEVKYGSEQLTDQLAMARTDANNPWVFAIGSRFVDRSMQGGYKGTIFLMMGCSTLYIDDMAEAFVKKGVSACIGWNASISAGYMDKATLSLVKKICQDNLTIARAVHETISEAGHDPDFGGSLEYYPSASGSRTLSQPVK